MSRRISSVRNLRAVSRQRSTTLGDRCSMVEYADVMAEGEPYISLTVVTKSPIELGDFVSAFTSLANQYQKFIRENYPDETPEATIYVREINPGSIVAILVIAKGLLAHAQDAAQKIIIERFVGIFSERIGKYFTRGGREETASRQDLKDFMGAVQAIAHDPDGHAKIEAVTLRTVFDRFERELSSILPRPGLLKEKLKTTKRKSNIRPGLITRRSLCSSRSRISKLPL
jgi:hypothetical protein